MSKPSVEISAQYVPALPNTGFEPIDATGMIFAGILLLAVGIFIFPYVRSAFASLTR